MAATVVAVVSANKGASIAASLSTVVAAVSVDGVLEGAGDAWLVGGGGGILLAVAVKLLTSRDRDVSREVASWRERADVAVKDTTEQRERTRVERERADAAEDEVHARDLLIAQLRRRIAELELQTKDP